MFIGQTEEQNKDLNQQQIVFMHSINICKHTVNRSYTVEMSALSYFRRIIFWLM